MTIAVIGSCVTRDTWSIQKLQLPKGFVFFARTSLASLFTPPTSLQWAKLKSEWQDGMVQAECRKTALPTIEAARPALLLLDLIDERFDLLAADETILNYSQEIMFSDLLQLHTDRIVQIGRLTAAADILWRRGADRLADWLSRPAFDKTRIVLHSSRWATHFEDDGIIKPFPEPIKVLCDHAACISDHNGLLENYERYLTKLIPRMTVIQVAGKFRVGDAKHPWGLLPCHFIRSYYTDFQRRLWEHGIDLESTDGAISPGHPSVAIKPSDHPAMSLST